MGDNSGLQLKTRSNLIACFLHLIKKKLKLFKNKIKNQKKVKLNIMI